MKFIAATLFKVEPKTIFRIGTCDEMRWKMNTEGMGSVIPIKVAEERTKRKMRKVWSAGESCPKKVMAPQRCEMRRIVSS